MAVVQWSALCLEASWSLGFTAASHKLMPNIGGYLLVAIIALMAASVVGTMVVVMNCCLTLRSGYCGPSAQERCPRMLHPLGSPPLYACCVVCLFWLLCVRELSSAGSSPRQTWYVSHQDFFESLCIQCFFLSCLPTHTHTLVLTSKRPRTKGGAMQMQ